MARTTVSRSSSSSSRGGRASETLVQAAVRAFRRAGFQCRKRPREDAYVCTEGDVTVTITPSSIEITIPGEVRWEYSRIVLDTLHTERRSVEIEELLNELEKELGTGARIDLAITGSAKLVIRIPTLQWEKAVRVASNAAKKNMYVVITNIDAEARLAHRDGALPYTDWVKELLAS